MKVAIIGAGLSGITAALELQNSARVTKIVVFEKKHHPGGLMNSASEGSYIWDFGSYTFDQNSSLVKAHPGLYTKVPVYRNVWVNNKLQKFPFDLSSLLKNRGVLFYLRFITEFAYSSISRVFETGNINASKWLINRITKLLLSEMKLENYIVKVQGGNTLIELSNTIVKEKLSYLFYSKNMLVRFLRVLKQHVLSSKSEAEFKTEYYPLNSGVSGIISHLISECNSRNIEIKYDVNIRSIDIQTNNDIQIVYSEDNEVKINNFDHIVSSINLNGFVDLVQPRLPETIQNSIKHLNYTNSIVVMIGLKDVCLSNKVEIIYSFEEKQKWRRLTAVRRAGRPTSVIVEFTFNNNEAYDEQVISSEIIKDIVEDIKLFNTEDIKIKKTILIKYTYPIYKKGYEKCIQEIVQFIDNRKITIIGRQGLFKYFDSDDVIASTKQRMKSFLKQ